MTEVELVNTVNGRVLAIIDPTEFFHFKSIYYATLRTTTAALKRAICCRFATGARQIIENLLKSLTYAVAYYPLGKRC